MFPPQVCHFSNQVLSAPSAGKTVTVKNSLTVALNIGSISTTLADYSQTTTCPLSPSTLAPGKTCTISVIFTPSALGVRSGSLKIADSASNSPQIVTLTGTGIAAVTVTPTSISFGNQAIGLKSAASSVSVKNNQLVALTINSISSSLGDYTTTSTCPVTPSTLAAGGTCTISVFFKWMTGAVLSGCSASGTIWTCTLARSSGYSAQVMWDSSQTCSQGVCQTTSYTPQPQFIQYRDLSGNVFSLNGSTSVPLGAEPIILESQ